MSETTKSVASWEETLNSVLEPRIRTMFFLGFAAGIPILLIFSSLSLWLGEAGVEKKTVTFFSWAALGYSFKFVWAPLVDTLPLPWLTQRFGRRRSWMLVAQAFIMLAIILMASVDPAANLNNLKLMAIAAVLLGFSSATQDIVIDAYRIESADTTLQAMMSSSYIAGYRLGMVVAGAGALYLASLFGSEKTHYVYEAWRWTYYIMAAMMLVGVVTTLIITEPSPTTLRTRQYATHEYLRLVALFAVGIASFILVFYALSVREQNPLGVFLSFLRETSHFGLALAAAITAGWLTVKIGLIDQQIAYETWIEPILDFFKRYGLATALLLLTLIGLYRISDIVLGVISNVFYQDMGFTKPEIATAVKTFGVLVSIGGGFLGGLFAARFGVFKALLWGAILAALSNLTFVALAQAGHNLVLMYSAITADNLAAGFAGAAFIAFLSSLTNVSFTAVQYAIFSSLMTLIPKVLGGYSGTIVENIGYSQFFIGTTLIGLPIIILVIWAGKRLEINS
ncbi:AmpG family muropeptide MFS transporter [Thiolinea disciformis]|uniref:AmpG family muropeptide MFS transporter n=1 Tax=Thiolinea disciformis TaxID=125614 RepID=UPI0003732364|nr:MFS transporter [Thiolinea disciformis]